MSDEAQQKAEFVLTQAQKKLDAAIDCCDKIDGKAAMFLGFCVSLLAAVVGFAALRYNIQVAFRAQSTLVYLCACYSAALSVSSVLLWFALRPREMDFSGDEPLNLTEGTYYGQPYPDMVRSEADTYQERIVNNVMEAERKQRMLNVAVGIIAFAPVALLIVSAVLVLRS